MVAMTRAHIADPEIVNKLIRGEEQRIRPCVGMTHCMGDTRPTCVHNAATGREQHWPQVVKKSDGPATSLRRRGRGTGGSRGCPRAGLPGPRRGGDGGLRRRPAASFEWPVAPVGARMSPGSSTGVVTSWRISMSTCASIPMPRWTTSSRSLPEVVIVATGGVPDLEWLEGNELATPVWDVLSGSREE